MYSVKESVLGFVRPLSVGRPRIALAGGGLGGGSATRRTPLAESTALFHRRLPAGTSHGTIAFLVYGSWRAERLQLNVYISSAADGFDTVKAVQMPELTAQARTLEDIPHAVRSAAAAIAGQPPEDFDVVMDF
jgi:hypothetical protein